MGFNAKQSIAKWIPSLRFLTEKDGSLPNVGESGYKDTKGKDNRGD